MKKIIVFALTAIVATTVAYLFFHRDARKEYEAFLRSHAYTHELAKGESKSKGAEETDRPDLAFMQDYLRTMDPVLRRPAPELLRDQNIITARLRDGRGAAIGRTQATTLAEATVWEERGPSTVGGRTRALLFDPSDAERKKVWAGGVSGGLWYTTDITNSGSTWTKVDDFWDNLSVSCITADPNNSQIIYVGTGEAHTGMRGAGIWKSSDGGDSWSPLASSSAFLHVRDIAVRNEGGTSVVYAAVNQAFDLDQPPSNQGLYRSADGGASWTQVLPDVEFSEPYSPTDIEIGNGKIWVGAKPTYSNNVTGSIIYSSTTGTGGWNAKQLGTSGQVELAVAPSDPDIVYAILEDQNAVAGIMRTADGGATWVDKNEPVDADTGIPADDFSRGQAWYDLTLAVSPVNPDEVIIGGIDLFRSTDGASSWTQISKWWFGISASAPVVHADQHEILFRPGFPDEAVFGNDGGVYYGKDLDSGTRLISARNNNYNVTQFYTAAIHPSQTNVMLGGTQDNGTQKFSLSGFDATSEVVGGDGAMCFIDQIDPQYQIASYVFNNIYLSTDGGSSFTALLEDNSSGNFINVGEYDSNLKILYSAKTGTDIYRIANITGSPSVGTFNVDLGSQATAMRLSPFETAASELYVGTAAGRLFRISNANTASPDVTELTGPDFSTGSISGIAFGANENEILVTFFNYGVASVWESRDAGVTWTDREGNLPNMPVRWVEYHPHNSDQAYIATELGVWSTDNIHVAEPVWTPTNGGLANVRTDMLRIRKSDGILMAATHGRGVFTAIIPSQLSQSIAFGALASKTYGDAPFALTASSTSGLAVTFESSNPAVASITNNVVTVHSAGTVTITAAQPGNAYYLAADPVGQVLTINKASQSITFAALTEKEENDAPFELSAAAGSGLPVTFTSSNLSVATISGNTVTIQGAGTTTITASQSGNANYEPAADAEQTLTVVSRIIVLTGDLSFGEVIIGETASREFTIQNTGTAPITVEDITYPAGFSGVAEVATTQIVVTVTFTPTGAETYSGDIVVSSNATSGDNSIAASGSGIPITDLEQRLEKAITVYPNPATEWITISGVNLNGVKTLSLTDETGRIHNEPAEVQSEKETKVKIGSLAPGVYAIAIPVGKKLFIRKFVKR